LTGKRVAVIGTGASGVQVIGAIADRAGDLTVFQRRPNWSVPLHNSEISPAEMADIKSRYDEIFAMCARTPNAFVHEPDRRHLFDVPRQERLALWERLYGEPGFGLWLGNFVDILMDETANAEISEFIADKIRSRVIDATVAEQLIPTDHGFGTQRVVMETGYYEVYNRGNVHLVNLQKTPIERITPQGISTTDATYVFDIIIYATGFDPITGSYDRIDIRGVDGQRLRDKWALGPTTFLGLQVSGFPNMIMPTGPLSGGPSTNFPRGIEIGVDWATDLMQFMWKHGYTREEVTPEAEQEWTDYVRGLYRFMLMRKTQSWFTGYNSNVEGHEKGNIRYLVYFGGTPRYRAKLKTVADAGYPEISFDDVRHL
jgi:cation diffusion facilitator CzcD-associated flavoprotein CzcO